MITKHIVSIQHIFISFGFINLPLTTFIMALELKIPSVGESVTEVTISQWLKQDGDYVEMDEAVAELESEKATVELNAEKSGVLKILVGEGEDVAVGSVVASIDTTAKKPASAEPAKPETPAKAEPAVEAKKTESKVEAKSNYAEGSPSPSARKILDEKGIASSQVKGTGKGGRITKSDALFASPGSAGGYLVANGSREERREKMSNLRKAVSRRL
ncbi:MAG: 2-oxoglutarate dehydrogenase E2 component (dihydrolipoamide succinyltransferase), partial [Bacteroidia bacterium]